VARVIVPIARLLAELGIKAKRQGRLWKGLCPSPSHEDKHPSWSIVDDGGPRHGSHSCLSCGFGGGPWELVAAVRDLPLDEAGVWCWKHIVGGQIKALEDDDVPRLRVVLPAARATEMAMPRGVVVPSVDGGEWHPAALAYLEKRGVPEWQRVRWHVGYTTHGILAWRVFVPVYTRGLLLSYVARAFFDDGRVRYRAGERAEPGCRPEAALWGEPGFDLDVRVAVVTEGVFKAMAMERAEAPNPCAILGATNLGPEKVELLAQFDALLIATDPDKAGHECAEKLSDLLVRYAEPIRVELTVSPDDADEATNGAVWREAMRRAAPGLRARRAARLGAP